MKYTRKAKFIKLVGKKIKAQRITQGISQSQLAFEAELPVNQIGRIERGEINTSISHIFVIAEALNVSPAFLLSV
ncbi:MAG TPA: helix-turn-helix transcriptional regulator [Bacteroidia bacterium]|nr:helix-turn-helix transcriptional regulator [Bacteroidia bacterium]